MNKINHYLQLATPILLGIAFGLFAGWRLMAHEALLYAAQEHSLWLSGSQFFSDMLGQPGGILSWMGCYLTQYFYHPAVGASLLILLWLCTYGLTIWSCRLRWWLCPLALLPVIMLLWAVTAPTYHIYVLKVPDWWFTPSLIALCVALLLIPFRWATKTIRLSAEVILLLSSIGYAYHWEDTSQVPVSLRAPFYATADNSLFLAEQRMERAATEGDWKGVLTEFRACKQLPTRQMVTFHNAALYHTGRLLNEWGNTIRLSQLPQFPDSTIMMPMTEMCGPRLYLLHGCLQFAHRWAMEDMVEYGPQIRNLRVMAEVSLLDGDYDLVRKYAAILKRTTFHRAEAEELEQLASHPELISKDARYRKSLILAQNQSDMLDSDDSHGEKYLWHHYSTLVNGDVAELNELCIHFSMLTQNTECFWDQFFAYAHLHRGEQMPRILQEAAYLYGTLEPGRVDISQMPFDKEVVDGHARFMKAVQAHLSMGRNEAAVGTATQREFGHTFYWFYYFVRHLETY